MLWSSSRAVDLGERVGPGHRGAREGDRLLGPALAVADAQVQRRRGRRAEDPGW